MTEKKILKGEADWTPQKKVLGWLLNGANRTFELPPDKTKAYADEVKKLMRKKKILLARFRKIVGKL